MDLSSIQQSLSGLALGPLRYFARIGSTNAEALSWAADGAPDLALVVADEQTTGRGRHGRRWLTPPGSALAFSLVLRPVIDLDWLIPAETICHLTALGALGVSEALRKNYSLESTIKWPNDVLIARRKVCGVLVEAQWSGEQLEAVVLGVGVNVSPASVPPDAEVAYPATCLETASQSPVDRPALLRNVLEEILAWRSHLFKADFLKAWEDRLAFRGEWVAIETIPNSTQGEVEPQICKILGLEPSGGLRVKNRNGSVSTLTDGQVRPIPSDKATGEFYV